MAWSSMSTGLRPRASAAKSTSRARLRALVRAVGCPDGAATSALDAAEVGAAFAGVDLDLLALLDEERDLDLVAGLERGGLGAGPGRVAPDTGVRVGDQELDGGGQLDEEHAALVGGDDDLGVLEHVVLGVGDQV